MGSIKGGSRAKEQKAEGKKQKAERNSCGKVYTDLKYKIFLE
jgi:hypothetical protein